jgi:hypothetical protein
MTILKKDDLKKLYEEEVIIQQNQCIENIVKHIKQLVISKAKEGNKSVTFKHNNGLFNFYNDEWVKSQIFDDLKRIFPDSIVDVISDGLFFPTITICIDWK